MNISWNIDNSSQLIRNCRLTYSDNSSNIKLNGSQSVQLEHCREYNITIVAEACGERVDRVKTVNIFCYKGKLNVL